MLLHLVKVNFIIARRPFANQEKNRKKSKNVKKNQKNLGLRHNRRKMSILTSK